MHFAKTACFHSVGHICDQRYTVHIHRNHGGSNLITKPQDRLYDVRLDSIKSDQEPFRKARPADNFNVVWGEHKKSKPTNAKLDHKLHMMIEICTVWHEKLWQFYRILL